MLVFCDGLWGEGRGASVLRWMGMLFALVNWDREELREHCSTNQGHDGTQFHIMRRMGPRKSSMTGFNIRRLRSQISSCSHAMYALQRPASLSVIVLVHAHRSTVSGT